MEAGKINAEIEQSVYACKLLFIDINIRAKAMGYVIPLMLNNYNLSKAITKLKLELKLNID